MILFDPYFYYFSFYWSFASFEKNVKEREKGERETKEVSHFMGFLCREVRTSYFY